MRKRSQVLPFWFNVASFSAVACVSPLVARADDAPAPHASTPSEAPAPDDREGDVHPVTEPADGEHGPIELDVHGHHLPPPRSSSDVVLEADVLGAAPRRTAADLLQSAPGVYVAKPEGDAVAHQIFLRGFDAEHGQDVEFTLNGSVPINQPSHVHGQGYADLNFILPEVVRTVRVTEGVFDPRQGDFAVAGSIDFSLGVVDRGYRTRVSAGSFGTFRELGIWAPRGEADETFGALAVSHSGGFGRSRASTSATGLAQLAFRGPAGFRGLAFVSGHGATAEVPGVVRRGDVEAGRVGFYDGYDDPSAHGQHASNARVLTGVQFERNREGGGGTAVSAWLSYVDSYARENFTGYTLASAVDPTRVGEGDRNAQSNRDLGFGLRAWGRSARVEATSWMQGNVEVGASFAGHRIEQAADLVRAPSNAVWARRLDAGVVMGDLGVYADVDVRLTPYVRVRGGVRADTLGFDVDDRLGGRTGVAPDTAGLETQNHRGLGVAVGPRAMLEVVPTPWLHAMASYGEGYRSPQALQVAREDAVNFARVRSFETGLRLHPWGGALALTATGFVTLSSNDLMFEPAEGVLEPIGPTTRRGVAAHAVARPFEWLLASASVTYTRATLDLGADEHGGHDEHEDEHGGHAAVHGGGAGVGGTVPSVPPVVVRADGKVTRELTVLRGAPLEGRIGAGFSFLSARPLSGGEFSAPVALLDATASARWRAFELTVDVFNVADVAYAANEFRFASNWRTASPLEGQVARHVVAGPPRSVQATLGVSF